MDVNILRITFVAFSNNPSSAKFYRGFFYIASYDGGVYKYSFDGTQLFKFEGLLQLFNIRQYSNYY
jgi:hypothetical protein